jgi:adenosine deaminase
MDSCLTLPSIMNNDSYLDTGFPLIDLHRHLDGAIRLETVLELAQEKGIGLPANDLESLRPHIVVDGKADGLMDFIGRFQWLTAILTDLDACRRVAYENVEDALHEGIDYVELRFSPVFMAEAHGLQTEGVVEAVADGIMAAERDTGVRAQMIGIMSRTYDTDTCHHELDALLANRDHLVAVDLAGDEEKFPAGLFVDHFRRAREAGLEVTVHAGEVDGPGSVWSAIRELGASRIGHGIHSLEDPALVEYLVESRTGLEVAITSNIQIGTVGEYALHPVKKILECGIVANLNTDDPAISGIDLRHEYEVAAPLAGLDSRLTRRAQRNALEMAFLSEKEKKKLLNKYKKQ